MAIEIAVYAYRSAFETGLVAPDSLTLTCTSPTLAAAGATACSSVEDTYVTDAAAAVPNFTVASGAKSVPLIVTLSPPPTEPASGLTPVMVGAV